MRWRRNHIKSATCVVEVTLTVTEVEHVMNEVDSLFLTSLATGIFCALQNVKEKYDRNN